MPDTMEADEAGSAAYQYERVLAMLIDNVLFGYPVVGNLGTYTADVIRLNTTGKPKCTSDGGTI